MNVATSIVCMSHAPNKKNKYFNENERRNL